MAILDNLLNFEPTTGTAVTSTADSTNTIDLGVGRDMGIGDDPAIILLVQALTAFTAVGAATLNIQLQMSADNSTFYTAAETGAIPKASLTANTKLWQIYLPHRPVQLGDTPPRYIKLTYTVATGPFTAGTLFAGLMLDVQANKPYAPGISIAN